MVFLGMMIIKKQEIFGMNVFATLLLAVCPPLLILIQYIFVLLGNVAANIIFSIYIYLVYITFPR